MSLTDFFEKIEEKEQDENWVKKMKSSGQKEVIFPFHSTNVRKIKVIIEYLMSLKEEFYTERSAEQKEASKQKTETLKKFCLIVEEKNNKTNYYKPTDKGNAIIRLCEKLELHRGEELLDTEKLFLVYLILSGYQNLNNILENFYSQVLRVYDKSEINSIVNEFIDNRKNGNKEISENVYSSEIFYIINLYKDEELLKLFKENSVDIIKNKSKIDFIESKISGYNLNTMIEVIEILYYLNNIAPENANIIEKTKEFFNSLSYELGEDFISEISKYGYYIAKEENIDIVENNKVIQKIYYGAPGTGKSYKVSQLIKELSGVDGVENKNIIRTTVYQDYSYYDFIGSVSPLVKEDDSITYEFQPGPFTLALGRAFENPQKDVFLVVEEMSRGNIASIFGDIFQLLDRKSGVSEYGIDNVTVSRWLKNNVKNMPKTTRIVLPNNLHILGTVNTSDQNVYVMDTAFKRRFSFEYISTDPIKDEEGNYLNDFSFKLGEIDFNWIQLYTTLNEFIVAELKLKEDKQIGQFFIKSVSDENEDREEIKNKLLQYLWEDVVGATIVSERSIFNKDITTFGKLYKAFTENGNVFSEEFIKKYKGQ